MTDDPEAYEARIAALEDALAYYQRCVLRMKAILEEFGKEIEHGGVHEKQS